MIRFLKSDSNGLQELADVLSSRDLELTEEQLSKVKEILDYVKQHGDEGVIKYTSMFDWKDINKNNLLVRKEEIESAYEQTSDSLKETIRLSVDRVRNFHEKQKQNSWFDSKENGVTLGQIVRAMETVGLYVPGGKAVYPSSLIMTAVPAKTAGVKRLVVTTPPGKDGKISPAILVAAKEAGVDEIYRVGGAQAIAALAYGTQTIPKVDKIVGPGNIFVTLAKKSVYGVVDIDMTAGPSEILVVADETAIPEYVAADLLSQAEHDELASSILLTVSEELADAVKKQIEIQLEKLPRKEIARKSVEDYGAIVLCRNVEEALNIANKIAPEHIELCIKEPLNYIGLVENAGAIFLGNYSPEALGDYLAGPSHVLPTSGTARFYSPLGVDQFLKKSSLIWFDKKSMNKLGEHVIRFAELEKFEGHANSIRVRLEKEM